jgi:hypothetical protein
MYACETAAIQSIYIIRNGEFSMDKKAVVSNGVKIIIINSDEQVIIDGQSTLDLLATINYDDKCDRVAINKEAIIESFFNLSTGVAGEILQKVVNYRKKLSIFGDFSSYTSKPLHDFIYECNKGKDISFVETEQAAIEKLSI